MIRITMNKSAFVLLILSCVFMLTTCQFKGCDDGSKSEANTTDTLFLNQWRREKAEKTKLVNDYQYKIAKLKSVKDSLVKEVELKKQSLASFRFKAGYFEDQLKKKILSSSDSLNSSAASSILDSLIITQNKSDTICDSTINTLERIVNNRDSAICFHQQIEMNLQEIQKSQELNVSFLNEQLLIANKSLRKKSRQSKLLSGGLLVLSGLTASFLITQHLK
jgi:hypothetical protein